MVKFIETELEDLGREVDQMWTLVCNQMEQAQHAVLEMDRGAAQQIMVRERRVDAFELKIDSDVEDFIALYTPVAVDLRYVLSMLKINTDLERIGDYADGIARFVRDSDVDRLDPELVEKLQIKTMFSTVLDMLKELQEALNEVVDLRLVLREHVAYQIDSAFLLSDHLREFLFRFHRFSEFFTLLDAERP